MAGQTVLQNHPQLRSLSLSWRYSCVLGCDCLRCKLTSPIHLVLPGPVLLGAGERAELAISDKYIALTPTLEGFVKLKENPEYVESKD